MEKENKQKEFKGENLSDSRAYFCKLCQCWHYEGSEIHRRHKAFASRKLKPRKVVKRRKRSFWDRW